ncbi:MAG: S8 family peptidase [Gammaproteobacteria bacterium]|nr:S8 family peptidase [Gammaproteobacteria bacterium]
MVRTQRLTLWLCLVFALPLSAAPRDDRVGGIIIKLQSAVATAGVSAAMASNLSATASHALHVVREMSGDATLLGLEAPVDRATAEAMAVELSRRADVLYAVPNYRRWPSLVPNDARYNEQWYLHAATVEPGGANLPQAWDITTGAASTVVAVLDTGILAAHEDLDVSRILPGYDFVEDNLALNIDDNDPPDEGRDPDPTDPGDAVVANECGGFPTVNVPSSWHGTLVTGVIGATTNNGLGIAGIDHNTSILPVRVLGKCGGTDADIVDGARWAMGLSVPNVADNPNPAKILNLSLGGFAPCTQIYQEAFDYAQAQGVVVVVSAGNEGLDLDVEGADVAPAECRGAFTIAATTRQGGETDYTNIGSAVDIAAPGGTANTASEGILTTSDSGTIGPLNDNFYEAVIGTSFSAPVVSGIVALALALNPSLTPEQLKQTLVFTAREFPENTTDSMTGACTTSRCGAGLVDAHAVVDAVQSGNIPGFFAGGTKIEVFGSNESRGGGLATTGLVLGLFAAAGWRYSMRRRC